MMKRPLLISAIAAVLALPAGFTPAADQTTARVRTQAQEQIYGGQLMTEQERAEFRTRMRAAKTYQEREQIRLEHHERMKVRAKERGVTLPDMPPAAGGGKGPGGGMGPGGGRSR